jgi:diaminohydroxyphosphoribosylaminopyrimidine deaminase/5-amino-6-(5-phosphoribosylamino)uracil reductase
VPLYLTPGPDVEEVRRRKYAETGINFLAAEIDGGRVALPELLDDLAAQGFSTVLVEGGARVAQAFLDEGLVDRLALFRGPGTVGADGVESPLRFGETPKRFRTLREAVYGDDHYIEYVRR